jgi:light-harvesting complex I chlorophyll a/b binding protein 1
MLAALGQLVSSVHHPLLPAAINGDKPLAAAGNLIVENPFAAAQIIFFIFVAEALGQKNQVKSGVPGDLLFDPLGLKPEDPETWEKVQLRELKNGRLAMLAIAGMFYAELVSGNGVIEAWKIGQVSPWGDGKGIF